MTNIFFKEESYNIGGAIIAVHKALGCGFLERVYKDALEVKGKDRTYCTLLTFATCLFHLMIKTIIMKKYLMFACAVWLLAACEKPVFEDAGEDDPSVVVPGDGEQTGEVLWTENDTARFYLSGVEVSDVVLTDCPAPSSLITDARYRLPTRMEAAQVLKYADVPDGCWHSKQRIMCYDQFDDANIKIGSTQYGTGMYYTFIPHSTVTMAGSKAKYCILPIRSERISSEEHVDITIKDEWN